MVLNFINWTADPEIFRIGSFAVRWYGLLFASAFYIGFLLLKRFYTFEKLSVEKLDNLAMYMIVGSLIGARFGHCLFYEPEYYLKHPLDIIKPWTGELGKDAKLGIQGLASHGGAVGILVAISIYTFKNKLSYLWLMDRLVIATALGGALIRLGNLMNHEIVGIETTKPWGFIFERLRDGIPRHPAQLYEAFSYLVIFVVLYKLYYKMKAKIPQGYFLGIFCVMLFAARFFIEFIKENQVSFEDSLSMNMGQYLSIPFIVIGIFLAVRSKLVSKKNEQPTSITK